MLIVPLFFYVATQEMIFAFFLHKHLPSGLTSFSHSLTLKFNSNRSNPYLINNHHFDNKMRAEIQSYERWQ